MRPSRGEDLSEVEPYRDAVSYSEENTFASDVSSRETLEAAILAHAESVARRLRRDRLRARSVVLKLELARRVAPGPRGYPLLTRRAGGADAPARRGRGVRPADEESGEDEEDQ